MQNLHNCLPEEIKKRFFNTSQKNVIPSTRALALFSYYAYFPNRHYVPQIRSVTTEGINYFEFKERKSFGNVAILIATDDSSNPPKAILAIVKNEPISKTQPSTIVVEGLIEDLKSLVLEIITNETQEYTYYVCGHFIGGILAQYISSECNFGGASFEAPGLYDPRFSFSTENFYDYNHPKFCNHILKPNDDNLLDVKEHFNHQQYFGDVLEHFPYYREYVYYYYNEYDPYFEKATKEYFFYLPHFIDIHFHDEGDEKIGTYDNQVEFNNVSCTNEFCHYYEKRKKKIKDDDDISKKVIAFIISVSAALLGFFTFGGNQEERRLVENRARRAEAQRRLEEERRRNANNQ